MAVIKFSARLKVTGDMKNTFRKFEWFNWICWVFFDFFFELVVYSRSLNPSRIYIEISKNCLQLSASKLLNSLSRSFFFKLWKNERWSEWPTHWKERTGIEGNNINTIAQMKKTLLCLAWQSQKYMYWLFSASQSLCCNYCHFMWARSSVCCVSIFFSLSFSI